MGFAIESTKPWKPPRKPKAMTIKKGVAQFDILEIGDELRIYLECNFIYINSKEARRLAKYLVNAANYLDGEYK